MRHAEGRHRDLRVAIHDAGLNFVRLDERVLLTALRHAIVEIDAIRSEHVLRHLLQPARPVHLQRCVSPGDKRRDDEIRITHRVIGMQVRDERDLQIAGAQSAHAFRDSAGRASNDARAEVDEIRCLVDDDCRRRPRAFGIGGRRAGAEQNDLR